MSSYLPPFQNLVFKTVFVVSKLYHQAYRRSTPTGAFTAAFALTSTSFYNSSLQANVVSRMVIDNGSMRLVKLFLHPPLASPTTSNSLSTIQMTPVLNLDCFRRADVIIYKLKDSTYFTRSLKQLTVRGYAQRRDEDNDPSRLLAALENLVALEVLDLYISNANAKALSVIARLPSLMELKLDFPCARRQASGFFDFLGDLENNNGFRKLSFRSVVGVTHQGFRANFARLFAKNLLTHLHLYNFSHNENLDVLIDAKLTDLQSLSLEGDPRLSHRFFGLSSKIADAIIASSSSLIKLAVDSISDEGLIKCAEHLHKLVELRVCSSLVDGCFLRIKGSCFASRLEILRLSGLRLSNQQLGDGFKYLMSLRKLDVIHDNFVGAENLQYLTAATSLEELSLHTMRSNSLEAIGQLTQLTALRVVDVEREIKSADATPLKKLVNLRQLTFATSTAEFNQGILNIADFFPKLEYISLGPVRLRNDTKRGFSRDEVTYLLGKCWPLVRRANFDLDEAALVMPYLRRRFPYVNFGAFKEGLVPVNRDGTSSTSNASPLDPVEEIDANSEQTVAPRRRRPRSR